MKRLSRLFVVVLVVFGYAVPWDDVSEAQANLGPTQVVQEVLSRVKEIKKAEPDKNIVLTPQEQEQNEQLSKEVNKLLDIEGISAYALQDYWTRQSAEGRRTFVALFTTLLEKVAYTNTGKFLKDLSASVNKEKVIGGKAMVYTSVIHEKEGRIDIDFKLHQSGSTWLVDDVLLDGVSLVRNLRTQCLKIVRENSFQELLRRMRNKIQGEEDVQGDIDTITERKSS